jgi:uncharacterized protein (TIGR00369 family)
MADADATIGVTYPPAHHVLRSLGYGVEHRPDLTSTAHLSVGPHLLGGTGEVATGALATLVDATGGGLAALAARPDWIATSGLTLHLLAPVRAGAVTAEGRMVRRGRTTVVLAVDLIVDAGRPVGTATMTFAILPRRDTNPVMAPLDAPVRHEFRPLDDAHLDDLAAAIGIEVGPDSIQAPMSPFVVNTLGAMQGGVVAMLIAGAATTAADRIVGGPTVCVDLAIDYLALAKHGPVRAEARVLRTGSDWAQLEVEVRDEGGDDRRTALARAVAVRAGTPGAER